MNLLLSLFADWTIGTFIRDSRDIYYYLKTRRDVQQDIIRRKYAQSAKEMRAALEEHELLTDIAARTIEQLPTPGDDR